jgi:hypothetical protein
MVLPLFVNIVRVVVVRPIIYHVHIFFPTPKPQDQVQKYSLSDPDVTFLSKCLRAAEGLRGAGGHLGSVTIAFCQMSRWTSVQSALVAWQKASLKSSVVRAIKSSDILICILQF